MNNKKCNRALDKPCQGSAQTRGTNLKTYAAPLHKLRRTLFTIALEDGKVLAGKSLRWRDTFAINSAPCYERTMQRVRLV